MSGKELDPNSAAAKPYLSRQGASAGNEPTATDMEKKAPDLSPKTENQVGHLAVGTMQQSDTKIANTTATPM